MSALTNPEVFGGTSPRLRVAADGTCRSCKRCRQKKVRCDGHLPACHACRSRGRSCDYPRDGRKTATRSRAADIRSLQSQIEELKAQLNTNNAAESRADIQTADLQSEIPSNMSNSCNQAPQTLPQPICDRDNPDQDLDLATSSPNIVNPMQQPSAIQWPLEFPDDDGDAGAISPNPMTGSGQSHFYGTTSLLHESPTGKESTRDEGIMHESARFLIPDIQNRLIAYAAVSKQRELVLHSSPSVSMNIDFDGIQMDLAMHLLDLHWNRLHYLYLLTYRPAIMDSLINNGPYVNKLLLNAIYLQSSLWSDRDSLRSNPLDPSTTGMTFYHRFKSLLFEHIDQPSLPTVVALLICGSCLIQYGKQNAGWTFCGMGYRMIMDLGYHLDLRKEASQTGANSVTLAIDIEIQRRVYWGAYASDKFQSLFLGRPPAMHESDGNIPHEYLDSYEELEAWSPYKDSEATTLDESIPHYQCRPAYALSTFQHLLQLSRITAQIIDEFYTFKSTQSSETVLLQARSEIRARLSQWTTRLPIHLLFNPETDDTPPPYQVNLHTTYWTLHILLEQAFLIQNHFEFILDPSAQEEGRKLCIQAALRIWKLVEAYKEAFSLRHAHYDLSYAIYSAVIVMLQHFDKSHRDHPDYLDCIRFFWLAIVEYQKLTSHIGWKKPFEQLRKLMRKVKKSNRQTGRGEQAVTIPGDSVTITTTQARPADEVPGPNTFDELYLDASWDDTCFDPMNDTLIDDSIFADGTLFGLFMQH
ncbi:hypothetical protein H2204_000013 [Knufia peltigerae]|uniref:Zn(2)-C6 fungal-type domain-containing protein n=1 Tax=Knufia peltigerae TaxID=1002370 RepID=A0AA38YFF9_9EURO|nr:hypothetical protein H2204_000013 [Knufia peltigerae]